MLYLSVLLSLILLGSIANGQSPGGLTNIEDLAANSSVILTGKVEESVWIANHDKLLQATTKPLEGNIVPLPNPSDFVVGRLYRVRVDEVIKKDKNITLGAFVNIFVPGEISLEGQPLLLVKQRHLLFLTPAKKDDPIFAGTIVYRLKGHTSQKTPFDPRSCYVITSGEYGAIVLSQKNSGILQEVRSIIGKRR